MRIRLERYGEYYRLLGVKRSASRMTSAWCGEAARVGKGSGGGLWVDVEGMERAQSNICRARSKIKELSLCNEWDFFATFTLCEEKQDRFDLGSWVKDFGNWIQNFKKKFGCSEFAYLIIPEQHKNGAWHAHGLLRGIPAAALVKNEHGYLDLPYYARRFGYISLDPVRDHLRVSHYITKYVTKDSAATAAALEAGQHLYYASHGLNKKEIVEEWEGDFCGDWENDFVKISKTMTREEMLKVVGERE